jgi:hypothetical protein
MYDLPKVRRVRGRPMGRAVEARRKRPAPARRGDPLGDRHLHPGDTLRWLDSLVERRDRPDERCDDRATTAAVLREVELAALASGDFDVAWAALFLRSRGDVATGAPFEDAELGVLAAPAAVKTPGGR